MTISADRRLVVTVGGVLDATAVPDLERIVRAGLSPTIDLLVLDLRTVEHLDDEAVAALVRIQARCRVWPVGLRVLGSEAVHAAVAQDATLAFLPVE
ncbi:hypothetical protein BJF78_30880 [Pseudonocardia sp. CNS-139]|nr:hypothetical protein BJF78_30880 [Pseudonocardia sp. CNS-139]